MAKLYLIAGHGAGDPGATNGSRTEASDVRRLCAKIKELGGSQVEVLDTSKNWYATGGISSLRLPSGAMLCEVHRDSGASSARGAHVIIKDGFKADSFDTALAAKLSAILPGRAVTVVKRGDLANVNRAAKAGINYRLVEVGFISNSTDNSVFDSKLAEIARAFLSAAGIAASATATASPTATAGATASGSKLDVDGHFGPATVKALQKALGTVADGYVSNQPGANAKYVGSAVTSAWGWKQSGYAGGSPMVKAVQKWAGCASDGYWGRDTSKAVQKKLVALGYSVGADGADGYFGANSCKALQRALNDGKVK